jgi:hypothetical protein
MKIRLGFLAVILAVLLSAAGCKAFSSDPCDKVYFDGDELVMPNCVAYSLSNPKLDGNGKLIYFEFKAICDNAQYIGSVTLVRDDAGNVIAKQVTVNGKDCF